MHLRHRPRQEVHKLYKVELSIVNNYKDSRGNEVPQLCNHPHRFTYFCANRVNMVFP